ncbi:MAG TPA: hypothetical protein VF584_20795 [Longimicrobium sp.]|jgi:hypothetical protein
MRYSGAEDRLNPQTPEGVTDDTLGGYEAVHGRAAAFQGCDGEPYTAAVEVEESGDGGEAYAGYLVFVRWAQTGTAVMGHLETGDLVAAPTEAAAREALEGLSLAEVRALLDDTIRRKRSEDEDAGAQPTRTF